MLAKFGVRAGPDARLLSLIGDAVDNVPGVTKVGPKTAAKWLTQYGSLDDDRRARGRDPRRRRREPARGARLAAAGQAAAHRQDRLRAARQGRRARLATPDASTLKSLYERFEFKSLAARHRGRGRRRADGAPARRGAALAGRPRARTPGFHRRATRPRSPRRGVPGTTRPCSTRQAFERWREAIATAPSSSASTPRRRASIRMAARIVGLSFAVEPGRACYIPLAHRYPGAPEQLARDDVLRELAPWFADPATTKLGQNVKYDEHVLANHGLALAGVAHDTLLESYVLESHKPHDMDSLAWRHLDVKTIAYDEVTGKGAARIGFDQVSVEDATAYSAEDADVTLQLHRALYPRSPPSASSTTSTPGSSCQCARCCSRWSAPACCSTRRCWPAEPGARRARDGARAERRMQLAGQPFNLGVAEAARRDPVREDEAAGGQEDRHRTAVHRRGGAAGARRRLPAAEAAARAPDAVEAEVDLHRQAAADGRPAHRPRAHELLAGDRGHRAARVDRPQPAEHSRAHGRGPAHPRGIHRARRGTSSCRPTIRRSSCGSWRTCRAIRRW